MSWIDHGFPRTATPSPLVGRVLGLNPGMMTGPGTNTYLVGRRDPILIDTGAGVPDYVPLLRSYLAERGITRPSRVIVTHRHVDHIGGVGQLREVFKGLGVAKMIHRDGALPEPIERVLLLLALSLVQVAQIRQGLRVFTIACLQAAHPLNLPVYVFRGKQLVLLSH